MTEKKSHLFSSENQPATYRKGVKNGRTLLIEGLKRRSMSEDDFIDKLWDMALGDGGGAYMGEVLQRYMPKAKSTLEPVVVSGFDETGTPLEKAEAVYNAMAAGEIPPDVGQIFIDSISKLLAIEEITELKARLDKLEAIVNKN